MLIAVSVVFSLYIFGDTLESFFQDYLTYFKIDTLAPDQHRLFIDTGYRDETGIVKESWFSIPFWKG